MGAALTPVLIADSGPLIRLAACGLLPSLRGLNRQFVLVDRVKDEVIGDLTKPFAKEISAWFISMNGAISHVKTVEGAGIEALKSGDSEAQTLLKSALRDSGERAIREYIERLRPQDLSAVIVIYEDRKVPLLLAASEVPLTLMTTRRFARQISDWGINYDAVAQLETISDQYSLKPAIYTEIDPEKSED